MPLASNASTSRHARITCTHLEGEVVPWPQLRHAHILTKLLLQAAWVQALPCYLAFVNRLAARRHQLLSHSQ